MHHIPYGKILVAISIISITTYIAILHPATKASKVPIVVTLRNSMEKIKIQKNMIKKEGKDIAKKLGVRNTEYHKSKYIMLILTSTISIFLFLTVQGYLKNIYHGTEVVPDNYVVTLYRSELLDEIKQGFEATGTIKSMSVYYGESMFTYIEDSKLNQSLKVAVQESPDLREKIFATVENEFWCKLITLPERDYAEYLKQIGIKKLGDNECIFVNYDNQKNKYYDGLYITNFREGDTIEVYAHAKKEGYSNAKWDGKINSLQNIQFIEYGDNQKKVKLNIAKVVDMLPKDIKSFSKDNEPTICMIVNYDTLYDTAWELSKIELEKEDIRIETTLSINSNDRELLDEVLQQIASKYQINNYELASTMYLDNENKVEEKKITQIFLYSLISLLIIVTIINIVNIIINDVNLRSRDFATLKSVGMDRKQFDKMIFLEYFSYLGTATVLGTLLSLTVIYVIYILMDDYKLYNFQFPYVETILVIIFVISILNEIIRYINQRVQKNNIINIIKKESI